MLELKKNKQDRGNYVMREVTLKTNFKRIQ
jgi:hypothetical protein